MIDKPESPVVNSYKIHLEFTVMLLNLSFSVVLILSIIALLGDNALSCDACKVK